MRVCTQCDRQAMQFKVALESGDVQRLAVNRDFISETLPLPHAHGACAVHVAAGAGRLGAVDWLAEHPEVDLGVEDDAGRTPLAVAAKNMHIEVARALTHQYGRSVTEVRDVAVLQRLAARVIMPRGLGVGASAGSAKTMSPPGVRGEGERASMCDSEAAAPDRDSMMERSCSGAGIQQGQRRAKRLRRAAEPGRTRLALSQATRCRCRSHAALASALCVGSVGRRTVSSLVGTWCIVRSAYRQIRTGALCVGLGPRIRFACSSLDPDRSRPPSPSARCVCNLPRTDGRRASLPSRRNRPVRG